MPKKPKVSVNKLAEFAGATSTRQQGIVRDQIATKPPGYKAFRYTEARAACIKFFVDGFNASVLDDAIDGLTRKPVMNEHDANDQKSSIDSLNELRKLSLSQFAGLTFTRFRGEGVLEMAGIDVKVCPDLLLRGVYKKKKVVGAVKFHISKNDPLDTNAQAMVATLLNKYVNEQEKAVDEQAPYQLMFSVDVFGGTAQPAPKAQTRILKNAEDSCVLYKLIWDSLVPAPLTT